MLLAFIASHLFKVPYAGSCRFSLINTCRQCFRRYFIDLRFPKLISNIYFRKIHRLYLLQFGLRKTFYRYDPSNYYEIYFFHVASFCNSILLLLRRTLVRSVRYSSFSTPICSFIYIELLPPPAGDNEHSSNCDTPNSPTTIHDLTPPETRTHTDHHPYLSRSYCIHISLPNLQYPDE